MSQESSFLFSVSGSAEEWKYYYHHHTSFEGFGGKPDRSAKALADRRKQLSSKSMSLDRAPESTHRVPKSLKRYTHGQYEQDDEDAGIHGTFGAANRPGLAFDDHHSPLTTCVKPSIASDQI